VVQTLAREVAVRINDALVVNAVNLLAIAIWGVPRRAIDAALLAQRIDLLRALLAAQPHSQRQTLTAMNGRAAIAHARTLGLVEIVDDPYGEIVRVSQKQEQLLGYQGNNVLHAFALPSLLACVVTRRNEIDRSRLDAVVAQFRPLICNELFVDWGEDETAQRVTGLLAALCNLGLLQREATTWRAPPMGSAEAASLESLARVMRQTLERHLLVIKILVQAGSGALGAAALEARAIGIARRLSLVHEGTGPDFADRSSITAAIATFVSIGLVQAHDGRLHFTDAMQLASREADLLLPEEIAQAIAAAAALTPPTQPGQPGGGPAAA
jgi:glycerol-3-phosphate O-acyltransferase